MSVLVAKRFGKFQLRPTRLRAPPTRAALNTCGCGKPCITPICAGCMRKAAVTKRPRPPEAKPACSKRAKIAAATNVADDIKARCKHFRSAPAFDSVPSFTPDMICMNLVEHNRSGGRRYGAVPRQLLEKAWAEKASANMYELLQPDVAGPTCGVDRPGGMQRCKLFMDIDPAEPLWTKGGLSLKEGAELLPECFNVMSETLKQHYGTDWQYDPNVDMLAVSCAPATYEQKRLSRGGPGGATPETVVTKGTYLKFSAHLVVNAPICIGPGQIAGFKAAFEDVCNQLAPGNPVKHLVDQCVYTTHRVFKLPYQLKPGAAPERAQKPCALIGGVIDFSKGPKDLDSALVGHARALAGFSQLPAGGPIGGGPRPARKVRKAARKGAGGHYSCWDSYKAAVRSMPALERVGEHQEICWHYLKHMHMADQDGNPLIGHDLWIQIMWSLQAENEPTDTFVKFMHLRGTCKTDEELRQKYRSDRVRQGSFHGIACLKGAAEACGYRHMQPVPDDEYDLLIPVEDLFEGKKLPENLLVNHAHRSFVQLQALPGAGKTHALRRLLEDDPDGKYLLKSNGRSFAVDFELKLQDRGVVSYLRCDGKNVKSARELEHDRRKRINCPMLGWWYAVQRQRSDFQYQSF